MRFTGCCGGFFTRIDMITGTKEKGTHGFEVQEFVTRYGIFLVLVVLLVIAGLISPVFYRSANIANILQQASVLGIISLGQTIVILAGGIDLSVASIVATSCVFAAAIMAGKNSMVLPVALFCLLLGLLSGWLNGVIVTRRNAPPFIVTLGTALIMQGIRFVYTKGAPFGTIPSWLRVLGRGRLTFIPVSVIVFLSLAVIVALFLRRSPYGRKIYAVGDNRTAAFFSGVDVNRVVLSTYVLSGLLSAFGGLILAGYLGFGDNWAGKGYELDSIAAVVVGGTSLVGGYGSVGGTVIGVLLMTVGFNLGLLAGLPYQARLIAKALIIA
ncbi:MAG: ABC transporter permease, partial [Atribacterota bacterium]